jgi:XTP/dITP diphosphohydrolase
MHLLVATTNPSKLREIRSVLADVPVALSTLSDLAPIEEPEETGRTFQENARLKALHYAVRSGMTTVAEDSGLSIDALGGEPGVLSARFLRPDASYQERFSEIFRRLAAHLETNRAARFVCAVAVMRGDRILFETTSTVEGEIADSPRGEHGFGYDPIFYYPPYGMTFGEIDDTRKLAVAHRGVAFTTLRHWLEGGEYLATTR